MKSTLARAVTATFIFSGPLAALTAPLSTTAQELSKFDAQIGAARTALSAGNFDQALALGDAAIRMNPERWDGYAVAGQALLGLKQYEPAADALSKAIERAPEAQQAKLRAMRRECLVAESSIDHPEVPGTQNSSAPVASSHQAEPVPQSSRAAAQSVGSNRATQDAALWVDGSTGLMWARPWYYPDHGASASWTLSEAQSFCAGLNLGDYSNWRLPTADELQHVFYASGKHFRWSKPTFESGYGIDEALEQKQWRPPAFVVNGDHFDGNRLFLWTSTPADKPGEHFGLYFGKRYSVRDDQRMGSTFEGATIRTPFQGYALCMRTAN